MAAFVAGLQGSSSGSRRTSSSETPLMGNHRSIDMSDWSGSTVHDFNGDDHEKSGAREGLLGSPITLGKKQATSQKSWPSRLYKLSLLVGLIFIVHLVLDGLQGEIKLPNAYLDKLLRKEAAQLSATSASLPAAAGFDGLALASDVYPTLNNLCNICDCSTTPPSFPAAQFTERSKLSRSDLPLLVRRAILDVQCRQVYSTRLHSFATLRDVYRDPSSVLSWDLSGLEMDKQTTYMFTKTTPTGKTGPERSAYMNRHVEMIHKFGKKMEKEWSGKYEDGTAQKDRQIVWIVVEDSGKIDPNLAATLAEGNINYIYFAFGPTRSFGNAQHNAALAMIHHLSNEETGMLGHGPVLGADDDAEIHEDLLLYLWRIKKIGIWPMGNLGKTGWEHAIWSDETPPTITGWEASNTYRKYPIDNGAFTFNSTLLGHDLPGPAFWPTDTNGGETEFIELLVSHHDQLEPVCKECHVAWHNHPLNIPHLGKMMYRPGK